MSTGQQVAELSFEARADQLREVRRRVREVAEGCGCDPESLDCIVLAVNEACMNIIQHAYGGDCSEKIMLRVVSDGDELVFRIIDFAEPVDECDIKSRDLDELRPGGIGVHLIHQVMDSVAFLECPEGVGNILELRKKTGVSAGES